MQRLQLAVSIVIIAIMAVIALFASPSLCNQVFSRVGAFLEVDMAIVAEDGQNADTAHLLRVYVNRDYYNPVAIGITGQPATHKLPVTFRRITDFQFEIWNAPENASVIINSMRLVSRGRAVHAISAQAIANTAWTHNLKLLELRSDGAVYQFKYNDPDEPRSIITLLTPDVEIMGMLPFLALSFGGGEMAFPAAFSICFCLLLLIGGRLPTTLRRQALIALCCSMALAMVLIFILRKQGPVPLPISIAVGQAAYLNLWQAGLNVFYFLAVLLPAISLAWVAWRHKKNENANPALIQEKVSPGQVTEQDAKGKTVLLVLFAAVVLLAAFPQFGRISGWLQAASPSALGWSDFDDLNWLAFQYYMHIGLKPFIDFLFPYAGQILLFLDAPYGHLVLYIYRSLVDILLFLLLYVFFGKHLGKAVFAFILLSLIAASLTSITVVYRYSKPIALLSLAFALAHGGGMGRRFAWFGLPPAVLLSLFYEPLTLIVAFPGLAILILIDGLQADNKWCYCKCIFQTYAPTLILVAALAAGLAVTGFLGPCLHFYLLLGSLSAYANCCVEPARVFSLRALDPGLAFWFCGLLAAYALFNHIISEKSARQNYRLVFLLALASLFFGNKYLIRPGDMFRVLYFSLVSSSLFILIFNETIQSRFVKTAVAACLILNIAVVSGNNMPAWARHAYANASQAGSSLSFLLNLDSREVHENNAKMFEPANFVNFQDELMVAEAVRQLAPKNDFLYIFGDMPILHILTQTRPVWIVDTLSSSPLFQQNKIVSLLQSLKPPVVWNRRFRNTVDGLPMGVRLPVILEYIVTHYRPGLKVGNYTILLPRTIDDPVDMDFWRSELTSEIDLKHLPRFSNIGQLPILPEYAPGAIPTVTITISADEARAYPIMSFKCLIDEVEYLVKFNVTPDKLDYGIRLDRLWFVNAVPKARQTELKLEFPEYGQAKLVWRKETRAILY